MAKEKKEPKKDIVEVQEIKAPIPSMKLADMKMVLKQEKEKRECLLHFIRDNLTPGVDYAMIHHKKKNAAGKWIDCKYKDQLVLKDKDGFLIYQCPACKAKYSLWKPGAESICGYLRIRPHFEVDFDTAEALGLIGKGIAYKCTLIEELSGEAISEGGGARSLTQDSGDINKCIKMSMKSSHIDATCRLKGLSEMFTQDIEDMVGDIFDITWKTKGGYDKIREHINDPRIKENFKATLIKGINEDSEEDKMIEWLLGLQPELAKKADVIEVEEEEIAGFSEDGVEGNKSETIGQASPAQQELFDKLIQSHVFPKHEAKQIKVDFLAQPSEVLSFLQEEIARRKLIEKMMDAGRLTGESLKTLSKMTQDQIEHIAIELQEFEKKKDKKEELERILEV